MIEQQGQVLAVGSDEVRVRVGGTTGCTACDSGRGCGAGIFGRMLRRRPLELEFEGHPGVRAGEFRVGQAVIVGIPEALFLGLSFRFYILPLLALLVGGAVGLSLAPRAGLNEDLGILLGGLLMGWLAWRMTRGLPDSLGRDAIRLLRPGKPGTAADCGGQTPSGSKHN